MRETYQYCKKCGKLGPLPDYFFKKDELNKNWKSLCIWCVEKIIKTIAKQKEKEIFSKQLKLIQ